MANIDLLTSNGYQFLTEPPPVGENLLTNTIWGDGPRVARGTDPVDFALWNAGVVVPGGTGAAPGIVDRVEGWGKSILIGSAGLIVAAILVAAGVWMLTKTN